MDIASEVESLVDGADEDDFGLFQDGFVPDSAAQFESVLTRLEEIRDDEIGFFPDR